jgi:steroid 5-alpha reductase family enzyme
MVERRPGYAEYIATTPAFVPSLRLLGIKKRRATDSA